ncbi:MAG: hypothetical protein AB7H71_05450 [Alphaproteobacteria bacterium]
MNTAFAVPLFQGLASGAGARSAAWLRPLTGADEMLLSETPGLPAEHVTALLAAATLRIGDAAPVTSEMIRELGVGDRERLLLALAAATFGPDLDVVGRCQRPDCGELVELPVSIPELARLPEGDTGDGDRELAVQTADGMRRVRFRLPSGGDQEEAARLARIDAAAAARRLLARCVLSIRDEQDNDLAIGDLPPEIAPAIEEAMSALDPWVEMTCELPCPACGWTVGAVLDAFSLLASGLAVADRLYAEIDAVARAYHWSEAEILSLPIARRRRYLALIGAMAAP